MTQTEEMDRQPSPAAGEQPDLTADLRELGENLRDALRAAWQSQERERLQGEIEQGLRSLRHAVEGTFEEAGRELKNRERMRERVSDVKQKVAGAREELRTRPVGRRVRAELHEMLVHLNQTLEHSKERWTQPGTESEPGVPSPS